MTTHSLSYADTDLRRAPARLFPLADDVSELTLVCPRRDYSASLIARAVEDCDAHLLNLNVTSDPSPDGDAGSIVVELRVSRRDPSSIARSLGRYGYDVVDTRTADGSRVADTLAIERLRDLIRRLEV